MLLKILKEGDSITIEWVIRKSPFYVLNINISIYLKFLESITLPFFQMLNGGSLAFSLI